jgi:methionyl-tRNA formyltransferase
MTGDQPRHNHMLNSIAEQFDIAAVFTQAKSAKRHAGKRALELKQRGAAEIAQYIQGFEEAERRILPASSAGRCLPHNVPVIMVPPGRMNDPEIIQKVREINPDCIAVFGTGLIKEELLGMDIKFINIHLGLSPWYRGTGGSFWPFYNNEPEYVGVTVFYLDLGIDSGPVIHQSLVDFEEGDWIHEGSVKAILAGVDLQVRAIGELADGTINSHVQDLSIGSTFHAKDFDIDALRTVKDNWGVERMREYIARQDSLKSKIPYVR